MQAQRLTGLLLGQACRAVKKCVDDLPFAMTGDVLDSMADSYQSVAQCSHRGQGRAEALRGILQRHVKDDGQSIGDDVAEVFRERGQRLRRELQAAMEATQKKLLNRVGAALQQAEAAQTKPSRGAMVAVAKDIKDLRDSVRRA